MRSGTSGLGVGLYLTGVFLFALNDALGKWLVADYGVGQLMMLRSIGSAFVLVPMVFALRPALLGVASPPCRPSGCCAWPQTRSRSTWRPDSCRSPT